MADDANREMTLEEIFARLDEITGSLEDSGTGLEASFALFQEGSALLGKAGEKIDLVQKQVQVLTQEAGTDGYVLRPMDEDSFQEEKDNG